MFEHASHSERQLVIWQFLDGKPGHESQTKGLVDGLRRLVDVRVVEIPVPQGWRAWRDCLLRRCAIGKGLPTPDLLVGAGHSTHTCLLGCRSRYGGRVVVLMKPSLPLAWFDLCLIPEHDGARASSHVLPTRGVLNPLRPAKKQAGLGLILLGGPSAHYGWDEVALVARIEEVVRRGRRRWILATSRRTPETTLAAVRSIKADNLLVVPAAQTERGWLAEQLAVAPVVWVTEDSVSMLYESLTAGAACGVLPVPMRRKSRVRDGLDMLLRSGVVCAFDDWRQGRELEPPQRPFSEAARCAGWIVNRWFAN